MIKNKIIKAKAEELGIDLCRITNIKKLSEEKERLLLRKEMGSWPQPFTNENIDELTDLRLHFKKLESTIVIGMNYNNLSSANRFLSAYITKKDYHQVLAEKLELLVQEISNITDKNLKKNINYKIYVDNAPFLERAVAEKAGVGFRAKNSMLINPQYGSSFFLGEILIDLKIEADTPLDMNCGDCRKCLDNCEGGALKDAYHLDVNSCISYLTQKKGLLPLNERKIIGGHIWGCDKCQEICPYNQKSAAGTENNIDPALNYFDKDLEYFLTMDRKNPPRELKATAMFWRGSRILVRNAVIAAVNLNKIEYFDLIKEKLKDNSPIIRLYAVWALSELDNDRAEIVLKKQLKLEKDKKVRDKIKIILKGGNNFGCKN
ncbi:MAG: tRNA epoxyqueuosine(34) reductase QueG [Halanaerobium sp.]